MLYEKTINLKTEVDSDPGLTINLKEIRLTDRDRWKAEWMGGFLKRLTYLQKELGLNIRGHGPNAFVLPT